MIARQMVQEASKRPAAQQVRERLDRTGSYTTDIFRFVLSAAARLEKVRRPCVCVQAVAGGDIAMKLADESIGKQDTSMNANASAP